VAKKGVMVLVLAAFIASGAFARPGMSAGFGGNFAFGFTSYNGDSSRYGGLDYLGLGLFALFDATFVEANIGWQFFMNDFTLGLYGKYPFNFRRFSLFPMLGVQYDLFGAGGWYYGRGFHFDGRFWIKLGMGADFNFKNGMYLRPSVLYGINFGDQSDREWKKAGIYYYDKKKHNDRSYFCHGLDVRLALGFKFKSRGRR